MHGAVRGKSICAYRADVPVWSLRRDRIPGNESLSDLKFVPDEAMHAFDFADSQRALMKRRFSIYHTILSDIPLGMQHISNFCGR